PAADRGRRGARVGAGRVGGAPDAGDDLRDRDADAPVHRPAARLQPALADPRLPGRRRPPADLQLELRPSLLLRHARDPGARDAGDLVRPRQQARAPAARGAGGRGEGARARAGPAVGADRLRGDPAVPDRVLARLRRHPAPAPARDRAVAAALVTLLEARGLTKRFGGVAAVDGCSFAVPEGTITALVGPNGSGKTTVFNLLTGYLRSDAGSISFAGRAVRRPDPIRLARAGLTRTFQQARVFP